MENTDTTQQPRNNTNNGQGQNQPPRNDQSVWNANSSNSDRSKYDWGFFKGNEELRRTPHKHPH